jgi:hypothetical protein
LEDNLGACGTLVGSWNSSRWESGWRTRFFLYDGHDAHAVDIDVLWAGRTFGTFPCPRYAIGVFVNLSRLLSDPTRRPPWEMISLRPDLPDEFCPHRLALGLSHKGWSPVCCYLVSARISTYERLAGYDLGFPFRHDCVYGLLGLEGMVSCLPCRPSCSILRGPARRSTDFVTLWTHTALAKTGVVGSTTWLYSGSRDFCPVKLAAAISSPAHFMFPLSMSELAFPTNSRTLY